MIESPDPYKEKQGAEALGEFFSQFGPADIYTKIVIETLLEELFGENIFVSGETGQEGSSISSDISDKGKSSSI